MAPDGNPVPFTYVVRADTSERLRHRYRLRLTYPWKGSGWRQTNANDIDAKGQPAVLVGYQGHKYYSDDWVDISFVVPRSMRLRGRLLEAPICLAGQHAPGGPPDDHPGGQGCPGDPPALGQQSTLNLAGSTVVGLARQVGGQPPTWASVARSGYGRDVAKCGRVGRY